MHPSPSLLVVLCSLMPVDVELSTQQIVVNVNICAKRRSLPTHRVRIFENVSSVPSLESVLHAWPTSIQQGWRKRLFWSFAGFGQDCDDLSPSELLDQIYRLPLTRWQGHHPHRRPPAFHLSHSSPGPTQILTYQGNDCPVSGLYSSFVCRFGLPINTFTIVFPTNLQPLFCGCFRPSMTLVALSNLPRVSASGIFTRTPIYLSCTINSSQKHIKGLRGFFGLMHIQIVGKYDSYHLRSLGIHQPSISQYFYSFG
ncbi:hypothetical protein ABKN59_002138 [Abortiporus biennis]